MKIHKEHEVVFNPTFRNQYQINWKNHTNVLMGFTIVLARECTRQSAMYCVY